MWKRRVKKAILKLNIQKTKIMASGPITLRQIDGETKETVTEFIFLGSKITADDYCSHEIKRFLLIGRKAMTNLDSILKSRDITFLTKVHLVKPMVFPVVEYGCESWTIKKAECWWIDAFNYVVGEDFWESLGLQRDQTSQSSWKSILNFHWKNWCWTVAEQQQQSVTLSCVITSWVSICALRATQVALVVKILPANVGDTRDTGSILGLGRYRGGGHGNPLQYSCLENSMNRGAWRATYSP